MSDTFDLVLAGYQTRNRSVPLALGISAVLRLPALLLYRRAIARVRSAIRRLPRDR